MAATSTDIELAPPHRRLGYHPAMDGIRGVGVVIVMLFHANPRWIGGAFFAVDMFFVLSGFLITRLILEEVALNHSLRYGRFYMRRVLRLFPAIVLVSAFVLAFALLTREGLQRELAIRDTFATLTYHINWWLAFEHRPPLAFSYFDHAWSLSIEEQFYLVWPITLLTLLRWKGTRAVVWFAVVGAVASATWRWILWDGGARWERVYYGFDTHADGLLIGCALGVITLQLLPNIRPAHRRGVGAAIGLAALAGCVLLALFADLRGDFTVRYGYPMFIVLVSVVIVDMLRGGWCQPLFSWWPLPAVGRMSYGLYLWHWPLWLVVNQQQPMAGWSFNQRFAFYFVLTFAIAMASYHFVEQRFLRLKVRFEPQGRTVQR